MPLRPRLALLSLLLCGYLQAADEPAPAKEGDAPAAVERAPLAERSVDDATALAKRVPEKEQQKLTTGDEEFLALWKPANVGDATGVVILIPGDGETADWPQAMAPLREKLPDAGWHTLSLSLPDPQGDEPPLRPIEAAAPADGAEKKADAPAETSEAAPATTPENAAVPADNSPPPSGISEEQRTTHAGRVSARIAAAIAFAQEKKAKAIVLLGHGSGGYWAARYLANVKPKEVSNLILVAAEKPVGFSPVLEELVPELKLATGDFYYQDQPLERDAAKQRMQASKRQKHPAYIQVAMTSLPGDRATEQEQLFRRVKGWLTQHLQSGAVRPDASAPAEAREPPPPPEPTSPGI
ncbi:MAG: alpha/beta hydrolase family protein [Pseudomonas sp.]